VAGFVPRHAEPEFVQPRLPGEDFCEAGVERHTALFQGNGSFDYFAGGEHEVDINARTRRS
jgi:hypothetical protein